MAKPTEEQLAFLESHGITPPRNIWDCKPDDELCRRLITYLVKGNGATDKGEAETLEDRVEVYEAALWEFMHLIVVPINPEPGPRTGTNGPLEVLEIDPKLPEYVANQKREGNPSPGPFHVTIVPANTMIAGGNVYGGDLDDYRVGPETQRMKTEGHSTFDIHRGRVYIPGEVVEPINFYNRLEFDAGVWGIY